MFRRWLILAGIVLGVVLLQLGASALLGLRLYRGNNLIRNTQYHCAAAEEGNILFYALVRDEDDLGVPDAVLTIEIERVNPAYRYGSGDLHLHHTYELRTDAGGRLEFAGGKGLYLRVLKIAKPEYHWVQADHLHGTWSRSTSNNGNVEFSYPPAGIEPLMGYVPDPKRPALYALHRQWGKPFKLSRGGRDEDPAVGAQDNPIREFDPRTIPLRPGR